MAKHIIGKNKSKGQRISCKGNVKAHSAIIVKAERVGTAMREALLHIKVSADIQSGLASPAARVVNYILNCAKRNAGNNSVGRGWTANLSPRTVRQLTEQGVFA